MRTSAFLVQKIRFFEIYGVTARTRAVEPVQARREGDHVFAIL